MKIFSFSYLAGGLVLENITNNAPGHNRKIWPQLLSNQSVSYIVHALTLYEHSIITLSIL